MACWERFLVCDLSGLYVNRLGVLLSPIPLKSPPTVLRDRKETLKIASLKIDLEGSV